MLDSLKQAGKNIGRELSRSSDSLTHFSRKEDEAQEGGGALAKLRVTHQR